MSKIKPIIPVPPKELYKRLGSKTRSDFLLTAFASLDLLTRFGGLKANERILDIGCGVGRTAIALSTFLEAGTYYGIDIVPEFIDWCDSNITPKCPNFKFTLADVYHPVYSPNGAIPSHDYDLPYPDDTFDFIFLISSITEQEPKSTQHLIKETARLLKPGGRLFITTFLLTKDALRRIAGKREQKNRAFSYDSDLQCYVTSKTHENPLYGYDDATFTGFLANSGLSVQHTIYGFWSGQKGVFSEDIVVGVKQ